MANAPYLQALRLFLLSQFFSLVAANQSQLPLAYGIGTACGISGITALVLWLLWLKWRARKEEERVAAAGGEIGMWCTCMECSGCRKRKGGGNGTATCDRCKRDCVGEVVHTK